MTPINEHVSFSEDDTFTIARELAASCKEGDVVCLHGYLGAGKTHFAKGFASFFKIDPDQVDSPTFVILQEYHGEPLHVYHFDAYRLQSTEQVKSIGAEEYLYGDGICLIEWPEKMIDLIPEYAIHVYLETISESSRRIKIVFGESIS
ncbi:MAG: tRNA (adenosine(37)-N6)-threonylcarbamoyltransferase complex ATPase subunit type 1 TsaE [Balneolales bacterium]|nr:tRNA (adenosine(37)-N6)-threonylcarbamoyltransferase complex ATPase subunit type 1 TsaE [Balneolales bacterium]